MTNDPTKDGTTEDEVLDLGTYTVVSGDTLWSIAEDHFGNGELFEIIARANGIENPDLIHPGQVITIPRLE